MCICCKNGNVKNRESMRQYIWVMIMGGRIKNKDMYELISKNIRRYRIEANMTQEELAMKANYSYQFIRRIEAPSVKKSFSLDTVYCLARTLDKNIVDMFEEFDEDEFRKNRPKRNNKKCGSNKKE